MRDPETLMLALRDVSRELKVAIADAHGDLGRALRTAQSEIDSAIYLLERALSLPGAPTRRV